MKTNCWEVKVCGRCSAPAGAEACPVCTETRLHGIHGGVNGGRCCWTIPHTKCGGIQGRFGSKFVICMTCDFYKMVKQEEKEEFHLSATILSILNN